MFEISKLINHVIGGDRNRKLKVVAKLGFENDLFNGCRRLDNLVNTGECSEYLRKKLPEAFGLDPELVNKAFKDTKRDLEERNVRPPQATGSDYRRYRSAQHGQARRFYG